ncbi:MAG: glycosyltransferase [Chitinophagaceae bacterium]|nr:glycosyltransferase [Chitinophagaceae bacterium]
MEKQLHIVCLDVPYPPDYGGVFDLYYKLKYLCEAGVIIHLHSFAYGRGRQDALKQYCHSVHYYKRSNGWWNLLSRIPYIVGSRSAPELLNNLTRDDFPVLLEGVHCTFWLYKGRLNGRKVILRLHNVEFEYYHHLANHSFSVFQKIYYRVESWLLRRYEKKIASSVDSVVTVSVRDADTYRQLSGKPGAFYLPVFTPWNSVVCREGKGTYCLYHGNLSVSENEQVALWLVKHVFSTLTMIPLILAGKNPSPVLKKTVQLYSHITLIENPSQEAMQQLIEEAQIHLLPSFSSTGIKLKLLHALFCGRHCIVNKAMVADTGLEEACIMAADATEMKYAIQTFFSQPFSIEAIQFRQALLNNHYNNATNAEQLIKKIWN